MGGRRHGLRCVTAPALDFGILTETKDSETGTVESSFTVTSAYTAEDFVSDTRSVFLACVTEDFGEQVASEAASLVDGQIASMSWYRRFEIWNDLASYDICGVANADHLIDGLEELSVALADGRAFDANISRTVRGLCALSRRARPIRTPSRAGPRGRRVPRRAASCP